MKTCREIADFREVIAAYRAAGESVALVPTMGYLHAGHMALVTRAKALADRVVATIFVNPTQFGQAADLEQYPRNEAGDLQMLDQAGVDAVLLPSVNDIYPEGDQTIVETTRLANMLHGLVRPGHFRGVTTVVARLFNIATPDVAVFGEKDYQQLQVIRAMVRDLHFPVAIAAVPTVREADGLAMSSRNARLDPEDRAAATVLSRALSEAEVAVRDRPTASQLEDRIRAVVGACPRASDLAVDIVRAESLDPIEARIDGPAAIMLSARFGDVLLIDQRVVTP